LSYTFNSTVLQSAKMQWHYGLWQNTFFRQLAADVFSSVPTCPSKIIGRDRRLVTWWRLLLWRTARWSFVKQLKTPWRPSRAIRDVITNRLPAINFCGAHHRVVICYSVVNNIIIYLHRRCRRNHHSCL